jgi:chromosome segregation ATPase
MDEQRSTISNTLGISVFGLLAGLSALSFLISHLSGKAGDGPAEGLPPIASAPVVETAAEEWTARLKAATDERDALRHELDALRRESVAVSGANEALKREKEALAKELSTAGAELKTTKTSLAERQAAIDAFASEKAGLDALRSASRGEVDRLKSELQAAKRKAEDDAKAWEIARAGLESSSQNLSQQNELLKNRLAEGMKSGLPKAGENAAAALNPNEAVIAKLREQIVALEQKLDAMGVQRNELTRALRAARESKAGEPTATAQGLMPER